MEAEANTHLTLHCRGYENERRVLPSSISVIESRILKPFLYGSDDLSEAQHTDILNAPVKNLL